MFSFFFVVDILTLMLHGVYCASEWIQVASAGVCAGFYGVQGNYAGAAWCFMNAAVGITTRALGDDQGANRFLFIKPSSCMELEWGVNDYVEVCTINDERMVMETSGDYSVNGMYHYDTDDIYKKSEGYDHPKIHLKGECIKFQKMQTNRYLVGNFRICSTLDSVDTKSGIGWREFKLAGVYPYEDHNSYMVTVADVLYQCQTGYEGMNSLNDNLLLGNITINCDHALNNSDQKIANKRSPYQIRFKRRNYYGTVISNSHTSREIDSDIYY